MNDKEKIVKKLLSKNWMGTFFGISQKTLDDSWSALTAEEGNSVTYISMEIGADRDVFDPVKNFLLQNNIAESTDPEINSFVQSFMKGPVKIPNYSGGLGILAGDTLKSFADLKVPVVSVSLLYRKGYFSQLVDSQIGQVSWDTAWDPEATPSLYLINDKNDPSKPLTIQVPFYDKDMNQIDAFAHLWIKMEINEDLDFFVPEILLDYSIPSTPEWISNAANQLYDSSSEKTKATQRRLLGAGVVPAMQALGITSKTIHLNEQHGVVVTLQLIAEKLIEKYGDEYAHKATDEEIISTSNKVAERIVYTIHTPVKAGHDRFDKSVYDQLGHEFCKRVLHLLASDDEYSNMYNFTSLAMKINRATNSVSRLHKEVTKKQFPEYADKISAITNGVHHRTWTSEAKVELYDSFEELNNWRHDPSVFVNASFLLTNDKFRAHIKQALFEDNTELITYINEMLLNHRKQRQETWIDPPNYLSYLDENEALLRPGVFTIGFARRFSTYKRADLIFDDIDLLVKPIIENNWPVQFIFAGKAHPADEPGKTLIKSIIDIQDDLYNKSKGLAKLVFIPGYDMHIAKTMVCGVHAWLNSPKRPLEASGTSGMKVAINGIPNISIMDGWWVEGYHAGQTGWKFGYEEPLDDNSFSEHPSELLYAEDSASFYKIFPDILKEFYDDSLHPQYIDKCIMNLALNCSVFNTHRMAGEYIDRYDLVLPAEIKKRTQKLRALYDSDPDVEYNKPEES